MKRRSLLRSIATLPVAASASAMRLAKQEENTARDKGLPAGPPLVPPGITETPLIPVTPAEKTASNVIRTFDADQMSTLTRLGEIVVPSWNGNPGARETGAAEFIDFLVGCSPQTRIDLYRSGLDTLNRSAHERFGKSFGIINIEQVHQVLAPLREGWTYTAASSTDLRAFLLMAKGDLLRATVNSEPYIDAISQTRRPRNASAFYWHPID